MERREPIRRFSLGSLFVRAIYKRARGRRRRSDIEIPFAYRFTYENTYGDNIFVFRTYLLYRMRRSSCKQFYRNFIEQRARRISIDEYVRK